MHRKGRAAAIARHRDTDPCPRCGHPLGPAYGMRLVKTRRTVEYGSLLDYDHNGQRTGYLGLSHHLCNRAAGGRTAIRNATIRARLTHVVNSGSW